MNSWSVYQSDPQHGNKEYYVKNTFELIRWLIFGKLSHIVTINKIKEQK